MHQGYFTLALHTHLPYVRQMAAWRHGEEMPHEPTAATNTPLLNTPYDSEAERSEPYVTVGFTHILPEQLADTIGYRVLANQEQGPQHE